MASLNMKIDKFTGNNSFSLWQIKMKSLLKQQGLWAPFIKNPGVDVAQLAAMEEKAHATIMLCLADDVITEVASEESAAGLWLKLESLYMTKSLTSKLLLKQRLFGLRMQEGTPLREHLDQLNNILLDLRNLEVKVEDEDAALILLVSLPLSYENFVQSFIGGRDTVTLEEVRAALHTRELRHKASGGSSRDNGAGLIAYGSNGHGRKKSNRNNRDPKLKFPCNYCKKLGHWKNECPELEDKKSERDEKQHADVAHNNQESEDDLALTVHDGVQLEDSWVLDSAASNHTCPHKEWFSTYEEGGSTVTMANGEVCKVEGIGSIRVRTHTGRVVRLNQVRHVPQLKKNLISLPEVTKKGYMFSGRGDELSVWKGSLEVLKGMKNGKLYVLKGSTIVTKGTIGPSFGSHGNMTSVAKKVEIGLSTNNEGIELECGTK